jgi:MFS family permease
VFSAITIGFIRTPERPVGHVDGPAGIRRQLAEGFAAVAKHPLLRPMALASVTGALFGNFYASLYGLYALNELGLSPFLLGVVISAGGVGSLAASAVVGPLTRRLGYGPTIVWTRVAGAIVGVLTPLAGGPPIVAAGFLFVPQLFGDGLATIGTIDQITVRQQVTPARVLGRVNGTIHVLLEGVGPIGALLGAALAEVFGIRAAIWISVVGSSAALAFLVFSPVRTLRAVAVENP